MAFWKPGESGPGAPVSEINSVDREGTEDALPLAYNKNKGLALNQQRLRLPIYKYSTREGGISSNVQETQILYLLENYNTVVIVGSTGSGKSTQIPQYLDEAGWTSGGRLVACTQPRRVAATSVAERVAEEMDCTDPVITRVKYLTDGMLVREMLLDPLLTRYSVIMIDEAHERSLYTDILLGLVRKVQRKRPDLRVIISSATVDALEFKDFFNSTNTVNPKNKDSVALLSVEGRQYPVDIYYLSESTSNYATQMVDTLWTLHNSEPEGDVLAFLTGQDEIDDVANMLREKHSLSLQSHRRQRLDLMVVTMYASLPMERQLEVFRKTPPNTRKIVIATNIAETSITIDNVVYVVDCGFVKIRAYNPKTDTESLVVTPISQASANQRAGRAGRVQPGKTYRLYTEEAFHNIMQPKTVPEMQRSNLSTVILQLKAMGIDNVLRFEFMSPPPSASMMRALELLYALGALDDNANLTHPVGLTMAEFPLSPPLIKMLLESEKYRCSEEALTIAAMLSVQNVFNTSKLGPRKRFQVFEGDHITLLNVYLGFAKSKFSKTWCDQHTINYKAMLRAVDVRNQLKGYLKKFGVKKIESAKNVESIRKCVLAGFFSNAAQLQPGGFYKTLRSSHKLLIHPSSVLFKHPPPWIIYHEVVATNEEYMRDCMMIEAEWLPEIAPHFYELRDKTLMAV